MSNDKITGVFVRLPLSDEQKEAFYARHYTGDPTPGMIAIGTPVTGGDAKVSAYGAPFNIPLVRQSDAQAAIAALEAEVQEEQRISNLRGEFIDRWINTCAQKDEQIDGLNDEVGRLRESLEEIELGIDALSIEDDDGRRMAASEMKRQALEVVRSEMKALEGPEA